MCPPTPSLAARTVAYVSVYSMDRNIKQWNVEPLTERNYLTWSGMVELTLRNQALWLVVNDPDQVPEAERTVKDDQARSIIGLLAGVAHIRQARQAKSVNELWSAFKAHFKSRCVTKRAQLLREFNTARLGRNEGVRDFSERLHEVSDALKQTDYEVSEDTLVMVLLAGLPEEYEPTVQALTVTGRALTLDKTLPSLQAVEQRLKDKSRNGSNGQALMANGNVSRRDRVRCWRCGKRGHIEKNCHQGSETEEVEDQKGRVRVNQGYARQAVAF